MVSRKGLKKNKQERVGKKEGGGKGRGGGLKGCGKEGKGKTEKTNRGMVREPR